MIMSKPIEDYGHIGNMVTAALVARDGSMDWLCLPRFDGDACFAALLGTPDHGYWRIAPAAGARRVTRRYVPGTPVLETTFETEEGTVTLVDFIPATDDDEFVDVVRLVRAESGRVRMRLELKIRWGYGRIVPWVRRRDYGLSAVAGPEALELHTPVDLHGKDFSTIAEFTAGDDAVVPFMLTYHPSHLPARPNVALDTRLDETIEWWRSWSSRCRFERPERGLWRDAVERSVITVKTLTFAPTGGIVAAPTTSLPERIGGSRNWDYRYCWIRDATFALYSLLISGYRREAVEWQKWLLRAAAGDPRQLQIMYGVGGERRLTETELSWLPGYEGSGPVRLGNAAFEQRQLDVPGELMDVLHVARKAELEFSHHAWELQQAILSQLEKDWRAPDDGIWEVRGGKQHFTSSRVMCWVAFDRGIRAVEDYGLSGPHEHWRKVRDEIRADILRHGWSDSKRSFVQVYGGEALDASALLMAQVGFLPPDDPRFRSTVEAIERELVVDGLCRRYQTEETSDGMSEDEGVFLACSFWLADAYAMLGRYDDAVALFEHLLSLRNDLGLLAEQYDPERRRQLGNFPQAFSHIALINTANNLASAKGPAAQRAEDGARHAASAEPSAADPG
jgi:GH15 family glucan-1,4-alpha-glucosidase